MCSFTKDLTQRNKISKNVLVGVNVDLNKKI